VLLEVTMIPLAPVAPLSPLAMLSPLVPRPPVRVGLPPLPASFLRLIMLRSSK